MNSVEVDRYAANRRSRRDRRRRNAPLLSKYRLLGRRSGPRRSIERSEGYSVDRHGARTVLAVLLIALFSILDAVCTLILINNGAEEINPVMAFFLQRGPLVFFLVKYLLTCGPVLTILLVKNYFLFNSRYRIKVLLVLFLVPFVAVFIWELYLLYHVF